MTGPLISIVTVFGDQIDQVEIGDNENIAVLRLVSDHWASIDIHPHTGSRIQDLDAIAELGRQITYAAAEDLLAEARKGRILVEGMARLTGALS